MNFFRFNIDDLQGGTDEKIPGHEPALGPARSLAGDAVQHERGTIRDVTLWRFKEFALPR